MYQISFDHPVFVHFIGIGGISMSGLAAVLLKEGFTVSGSDAKKSALTTWLEEQGAQITYGQKADNIRPEQDVIVYTAAIHPDNPEYAQAVRMRKPMLTRAQLLGQIMGNYEMPIAVAGTHGKTTTTSMLSSILLSAGMDPTISVGGILKAIGGNFRLGSSKYFITEACEYTNSYLSLHPKISLILNVDADHLDFFKDIEQIRASFRDFAALLPADGTLIINGSIPRLHEITDGLGCQVLTYGTKESDYYPEEIEYSRFGCGSFTLMKRREGALGRFTLNVPGEHNIQNATASLAAADILHVPLEDARKALAAFSGADRRFERKGIFNGVIVIDDYAHHPTEITATLKAARTFPHKTLWCVFQPHTYTRTNALMDDFARALCLADKVLLADIYAARELNTLGVSSQTLAEKINALGGDALYLPTFRDIEEYAAAHCAPGDLLITMGAGDIVNVGERLLER